MGLVLAIVLSFDLYFPEGSDFDYRIRTKPLAMRRISILFLLFPFALFAQEESCTVLGVQELSQLYQDLIDAHAELQAQFALLRGIQETTDNGDGTVTFTFTDGTTFTTGDLTGPAGANGQDGLSAYQTWLALGNTGTEEEFLMNLASALLPNTPSNHSVFDSDSDGMVFEVPDGVSTLSIELLGASGGSGGDVCVGAPNCYNGYQSGAGGGRALRVLFALHNLAPGDIIEFTAAEEGEESQATVTCNLGFNGWNNFSCGPAPSGESAGLTELFLNGESLIRVSGGAGGGGAYCSGGCYSGASGANGSLTFSADWLPIISSENVSHNTSSRLVIRY